MIIGNYLFELKNFEHIASRSEESNCFGAVLYVNGRALADCGNSGHGGQTDIRIYPELRELGQRIEEFLKTLPTVKPEGFDIELDHDLEYIVDELAQKAIEGKTIREMKKKTKKHLVFKTPHGYTWRGWKRQTIASMLSHSAGREEIEKIIAEELAKGNTLLNENIPDELIP
jgi:hypothetical protein